MRIFQQAEDRAAARKEIEARYNLTPIQSDVIASMTLAQVTRLDATKYAKEKEELRVRISELERLLSDRKELISLLKKEMQQLIKQFGDERRTTIDPEGQIHAAIEEVASLHEREPLVVAFTRNATIKALPSETFKSKGKNGNADYTPVRGDEQLRQLIATTSQDYLLCVCSTGRVCQIAVHRIPEGKRSTKGEPVRSLLGLAPDEEVVTILPIESYDEDRYLVTFSAYGKVKKSPLSEYKTIDVDGAQDMKLANGDRIVTALISHGRGEYFVTADNGQTLRFSDEQLRAQGRVGQGVAAMALGKGATVVSASYLDGEQAEATDLTSLLVVTRSSLGKKVLISEYPQKGRATAGVVSSDLQEKDHILLTILLHEDDTLLVTWSGENGEKGEHATVIKATELKAFPHARKGVPIVHGRIMNAVRLV